MLFVRKIHRWLGIIAVIFFLSVSITGVVLQGQAIFGEAEGAREAMAAMRSPVTTAQPFAVDAEAFVRAWCRCGALSQCPGCVGGLADQG